MEAIIPASPGQSVAIVFKSNDCSDELLLEDAIAWFVDSGDDEAAAVPITACFNFSVSNHFSNGYYMWFAQQSNGQWKSPHGVFDSLDEIRSAFVVATRQKA